MVEPATALEGDVRNPLVYSGADLAARALSLEWLETDGLGGFACGTADGARTRKYHGWYAPAIPPPRKRWMLVAGCEEFVREGTSTTGISTQVYRNAVYPQGRASLTRFALEPFPTWLHRTDRFLVEKNVAIAESLKAFAAERGHTLLELAMSWLAQQPQVASIIAGATSAEQIRTNAAAVRWQLTPADLAEIDRLAPRHSS